jgi:hypothetical protein
LLDKVAHMQRGLTVSVRHLNRLRATWQRNRRKGRPRHVACSTAAGGALVQVAPHLSYVGVHLFAHWLDQQEAFEPVVARLQQAIEAHKRAHPADNFALLHHRDQTLRRRFEALFLAPLFGIEHLTAFDTHEQPLQTLLGRGYHSTTLSQFLGQLERIDAAAALLPALLFYVIFAFGPLLYTAWLSFFDWDGLTVGTWVGIAIVGTALTFTVPLPGRYNTATTRFASST